jgi:DNA-binding transcriptional ArsR family regulator
MARAMAHPVRVKALAILNQRVASPRDIAAEIDVPIPNVAYHVRALLQLGCIEEVETRAVRGALEHRYRALRRALVAPAEWKALPAAAKHGLVTAVAQTSFDEVASALADGAFERRADSHLSNTGLLLDEQGWGELAEALDAFLDRAMELQAQCAVRLQDGERGGPEVRSSLTLMHYEPTPRERPDR